MNSPRLRSWRHDCQQYILLEHASLKQACPSGVYLTLKPGNPLQWSGIIFVRKGPYAPAILRFQITFPSNYPLLPPSITFISDIFHPLIAPLTTYTYTTGSSTTDTVSATDEERLPAGGFSLRYGFSQWFGRDNKGAVSSTSAPSNAGGAADGREQILRDAIRLPPEDLSTRSSSAQSIAHTSGPPGKPTRIVEVLQYMKHSFEDAVTLDSLPLEAAGNAGAWKAWQAYRRSTNPNVQTLILRPTTQQHDEWSWDGVWEERVRKGLDASIADSTLYSNANTDEMIRFKEVEDDFVQDIIKGVASAHGGL